MDGNYQQLVAKYSDRGLPTNIAIGVRPSGIVHIGNISTLGLAGVFAADIGPHLGTVDITVCDVDLPDSSDWSIDDSGYVRYFGDLPDPAGRESSLLAKAMKGLTSLTSGLEAHLGVGFKIRNLSDVQRDEGFRNGLRKVLDTPGLMKLIHKQIQDGDALVFPICSSCRTSNPQPSRYRDGVLSTSCTNPDCDVEEYDMRVEDCDKDLAVHFFIDPLRDKVVQPYADVHVFGGDYADPHGFPMRFGAERSRRLFNKVEKILEIASVASGGNRPDILLGAKFYARDGSKMSKSRNNGLSLDVLQEHFGDSCPERVIALVKYVVREGYRNVDYRIVEKELLGVRD